MYFVHSFHVDPVDPKDVLAKTFYGGTAFCSVVRRKNVMGCQFHPEKSAQSGLKILENFINLN
jgi:glutamine amidotransferase